MKKCPFCKAEIEDNARFCLYCMKPLNEKEVIPPAKRKKQWWWLIVVGVLLLVLLLIRGGKDLPESAASSETSSQNTASSTTESTGESTPPAEPTAQTTTQPSETGQPTEQTTSQVIPEPSTKETTEETVETTTVETTQNTTYPTSPQETTEQETTVETTAPETPKPQVVYTYRAARAGDDFNANYANAGNDIVITGISQPAADGTYDIPAYIDGKKVIAIVANAFSGSNAKAVFVPDTVKTIWNHAFAGCALTDIYFRGDSLYVESKAFSGPLTIHCSPSCNDRNFRNYRNCAASYGATWAEWNG